jgi:hypothetical protein
MPAQQEQNVVMERASIPRQRVQVVVAVAMCALAQPRIVADPDAQVDKLIFLIVELAIIYVASINNVVVEFVFLFSLTIQAVGHAPAHHAVVPHLLVVEDCVSTHSPIIKIVVLVVMHAGRDQRAVTAHVLKLLLIREIVEVAGPYAP